MKLRLLVAVLLLANLLFGAWHVGWLDSILGAEARTDRDPARVLQQVNAQAISVTQGTSTPAAPRAGTSGRPAGSAIAPSSGASSMGSSAVAAVAAAISAATGNKPPPPAVMACLESGPLTETQIATAESSVASLPSGTWRRVSTDSAATYGVLFGPFKTREALRAKVTELEAGKFKFDRVPMMKDDGSPLPNAPTLLVLKQADSREAATQAMEALASRGIKTARVAPITPPTERFKLRVDSASEAQVALLRASGTGVEGVGFGACSP